MANVCIPPQQVAQLKAKLERGEISTEQIKAMLPSEKAALKTLLEDFVSDKLKVSVTSDEVKIISEKAKKIDQAQQKLGDGIGNPDKLKENLDFFKAKKEMDDYLQSHSPAPKTRVLTGTIGRGMMLASVKSPILNIGSNVEIGLTEAIARRVANRGVRGADNQLARDYVKMANKIYQQSGYDISRMLDLKDTGAGGSRVLGETVHAKGPGAVRKVGQVVEDTVFKQLMGAPDAVFAATHFADSVSLAARKMANGDKAKGRELMMDAMQLNPKTPEGELLRAQGILDAQTATWTNSSWASKVSEGIRKVLNDVSGDARVGDYVLPFVKTPANVIATSMDYAGGGGIKALVKTVKAIKGGNLKDRDYIKGVTTDLVRAGLGLTGALVIASNLKDEDFVGAYDPNRAQIEQLRNSNDNVIRIGNKWVSTDWLGPLSIPVTSILYARKYGNTKSEKSFQYAKGAFSNALNIPGVEDIAKFTKDRTNKKNQTLSEATSDTKNYVLGELSSRLIPSFISDVAKGTDKFERQTSNGISAIESKIPGLREKLPIKKNIFGENVKTEPAWSSILFGARVKTSKEDAVIKEISRVSDETQKSITFSDWDKKPTKTIEKFKQSVSSDKFQQAKADYGRELRFSLGNILNNGDYKNSDDAGKLQIITDKDNEAMKKVFTKYGFKNEASPQEKRNRAIKAQKTRAANRRAAIEAASK